MIKGVMAASALVMAVQLSGCIGGPVAERPEQFLSERRVNVHPKPDAFDYCWDHGCNRVSRIGLTEEAWSEAVRPLRSPPASAEEERQRLRKVVGRFELAAAELAGTVDDRGGTMTAFGAGRQLDCVDETANTTVLLMMLEGERLLRWHQPSTPAGRGNVLDGVMPHRTASIVEKASGAEFALDSWFHDNGVEAEVVTMALWLSGWSPDDAASAAVAVVPAPAQATPGGVPTTREGALQVSREGRAAVPECCAQAVAPGERHREGSSDHAPQT